MFVNGEALQRILWLMLLTLVVLAAAGVAHLLWVSRRARSPRLRKRSLLSRRLLVGLAFVTPLLSFYTIEINDWRRRRSDHALAFRSMLVVIVVTFALIAVAGAVAAHEEMRYAAQYRTAQHAARIFTGTIVWMIALHALLFMVARVVTPGRAVWIWAAMAAATDLLIVVA